MAAEFLELKIPPEKIVDCTSQGYAPPLREGVDASAVGLDTLWDVGDELKACVDSLERENPDSFTPGELVSFFADHGCGDVLPRWTPEQIKTSTAEGKIPVLANWRDALASGAVGLDAMMNLAGLNSFAADQKAMDDRVRGVLGEKA